TQIYTLSLHDALPIYAFPKGHPGDITIGLRADTGQVTLSVRDTGIGLPTDLDFRHTESLGLQLVTMLTEQLGGTITLSRNCGTRSEEHTSELQSRSDI